MEALHVRQGLLAFVLTRVIRVPLLADLRGVNTAWALTVGWALVIGFRHLIIFDLHISLLSHILSCNISDIFLVNKHLFCFLLLKRLLHDIVLSQLYRDLDNSSGFLDREAVMLNYV